MTNDTPVRDAAQLAAEEIATQFGGLGDHFPASLKADIAHVIRKYFPSPPLPVSGEIPTPCHHTAIYYSKEHDNYYCSFCNQGMGVAFYDLVTGLQKELATERAAREKEIPTITNRTKNMARERLGEVLRHGDGPNSASHGCVEVTKAVAEIEYLIARAEAAESTLAELYELSRPSLHSNPLSAIKLAIENGKNFATERAAGEAALNSFHAANKERLALKDRAEVKAGDVAKLKDVLLSIWREIRHDPKLNGQFRGRIDAALASVPPASGSDPETFPCAKCGKPRTKAEGGEVFTVCDE